MPSSATEEWKVGSTFSFDLKSFDSHLWVIITKPSGSNGSFLAVNMSSVQGDPKDGSCLLKSGDHPFVRHLTEIRYDQMKEMTLQGPTGIYRASNLISPHAPVSPEILNRIQKGAIASRFTKERYKNLIKIELGK